MINVTWNLIAESLILIKTECVSMLVLGVLYALYKSTSVPKDTVPASRGEVSNAAGVSTQDDLDWININMVYVLVACLLMIAQDQALRPQLFRLRIPTVLLHWYSERNLSEVRTVYDCTCSLR